MCVCLVPVWEGPETLGLLGLTYVNLVVCLCIADALKLELLQGLGKLLDSCREV